MTLFKHITLALFLCIISAEVKAQNKTLVQVSGVVLSPDETPVPFSAVKIKSTRRGTLANVDGFFTIAASERDTLEFSALGFKTTTFIIPAGVTDHKLTHNPILRADTIDLDTALVYPWPTKEAFRQAFLNMDTDNMYDELAKMNLDRERLQQLYNVLAKDGQENQAYLMQQMALSYYYAGGQTNFALMGGTPIPSSLLSPIAWLQFAKALKSGALFRKKE